MKSIVVVLSITLALTTLPQKQTSSVVGHINESKPTQATKIVEVVEATAEPQKAPEPAPTPVSDSSDAKMFIYNKESGNNPNSINRSSGACGLGQALPCSKMGCSLGDYACQDAFFTKYMQSRYGTWENAKAFWLSHHWW